MTKIVSVSVDVANDSVSIAFDDGSSQVITAPIVPATQGVGLEDLQKVETDVKAVEADVEGDIAKEGTGAATVVPAESTSNPDPLVAENPTV